jgi:uncharacterized membrane protein YhiD involved in acid resistance
MRFPIFSLVLAALCGRLGKVGAFSGHTVPRRLVATPSSKRQLQFRRHRRPHESCRLTLTGEGSSRHDAAAISQSPEIQHRWVRRAVLSGFIAMAAMMIFSRRTAFASSEPLLQSTTAAHYTVDSLRPPVSRALELRLTVRLLYAAIAGSTVGWERSASKHSAGIRTMSLVSLGAAAFTICSMYGFGHLNARYDASRIASNIVSGVGFLGAGVITTATRAHSPKKKKLGELNVVHGLTTAAAIWLAAAVGVASGLGLYYIASTTAAITIAILRFGRITHTKQFKARAFGPRQRRSVETHDTSTWDEVPSVELEEEETTRITRTDDNVTIESAIRKSWNTTDAADFLFEDPEEQMKRIRRRTSREDDSAASSASSLSP